MVEPNGSCQEGGRGRGSGAERKQLRDFHTLRRVRRRRRRRSIVVGNFVLQRHRREKGRGKSVVEGREKQLDVKLPIRKGRKGRKEREDFKWGSHNICFFSPLDLIVFSRNLGRAWMVCEVAFCNPPHHELHVCRRAAPRRP